MISKYCKSLLKLIIIIKMVLFYLFIQYYAIEIIYNFTKQYSSTRINK